MKSMKIDRVINFPFPTPPSHESLESAEKLLVALGALKVNPCRGTLKEMKEGKIEIVPYCKNKIKCCSEENNKFFIASVAFGCCSEVL